MLGVGRNPSHFIDEVNAAAPDLGVAEDVQPHFDVNGISKRIGLIFED
jgi:hypothetical protein